MRVQGKEHSGYISENLMVPQHGFNVKSLRKRWETAQKSDQ